MPSFTDTVTQATQSNPRNKNQGEQDVSADRQQLHNINLNRPALTRRQDISVSQDNTTSMPLFRTTLLCTIGTCTWAIQMFALTNFAIQERQGAPTFNIIHVKSLAWDNNDKRRFMHAKRSFLDDKRPIAVKLRERGFDMMRATVTQDEAQRQIDEYKNTKLAFMLGAIGAAMATFVLAWKAWEQYSIGLCCVLLGPVALLYGAIRAYRMANKSSLPTGNSSTNSIPTALP